MDTVVFDKTGTLTAGKPTVVEVRPLGGGAAASNGQQQNKKQQQQQQHVGDPAELLLLAAAVERGSTHPLARAIAAAASQASEGNSSSDSKASSSYTAVEGSFVQEPGSGVTATVAGRRVAVGTLEWVTRQPQQEQQAAAAAAAASGAGAEGGALSGSARSGGGAPSPLQQQPAAVEAEIASAAAATASRPGHILVYVGLDGRVAGTIEIADELRPHAASTVQQLTVRLRPAPPGSCACSAMLAHTRQPALWSCVCPLI